MFLSIYNSVTQALFLVLNILRVQINRLGFFGLAGTQQRPPGRRCVTPAYLDQTDRRFSKLQHRLVEPLQSSSRSICPRRKLQRKLPTKIPKV